MKIVKDKKGQENIRFNFQMGTKVHADCRALHNNKKNKYVKSDDDGIMEASPSPSPTRSEAKNDSIFCIIMEIVTDKT